MWMHYMNLRFNYLPSRANGIRRWSSSSGMKATDYIRLTVSVYLVCRKQYIVIVRCTFGRWCNWGISPVAYADGGLGVSNLP